MRRWIRNTHIYLGLLCSAYLVVFGLSSLSMNHPGTWLDSEPSVREWTVPVPGPVPAATDRVAVAKHVQRAIELDGYLADYLIKVDAQGALQIQVYFPGRRYDIAYDRAAGSARVTETHKGIWGVLRSLHGRAGFEALRAWSISWRLYTEVTVLALGFSVLSGAILWWPRVKSHGSGIFWVTAGGGFCAGLMFWIWI